MQGQEPAITRTDPKAYYLYLQTQGISPRQAVQMVEQRFGPPKGPDDRARDEANQAQSNALVQVGGTVAGAIAGKYIYNAVSGWIDGTTGAKVSEEVVKNAAQQTGQSLTQGTQSLTQTVPVSTTAGSTASSTAGTGMEAFNKNFTPVNPGSLPAGQQVPEGMTAIRSNVDGTVQVVPTESLADEGFMSSVNWNAVGSGALAALSAYQAYKSYQEGDKIGAGLSGASAVSLGAMAANQAGLGFAGSQSMAAAAPYLGVAAGLYQGYQTAEMIGDTAAGSQRNRNAALGGAASGAMIGGAAFGPVGLAVGAAVGALAGAVGSWTGSSKGKAQFMRDGIRGVLQERGLLDENFQGSLADGTKYDFGKDGSTLKWKNIDKIIEKQPAAWNAAVPLTDAIAAAYGFVGQKASDISAWYAKGAVSNAGDDASVAIKNAQHFAQQQGLTFEMIKARLDEAMKDERINQSQYDYYLNGAKQVTAGVKPQQGPPQPQGAPPPGAPPQQPPPQQGNMSIRQLLEQNMQNR
jgi:hypothetical protein